MGRLAPAGGKIVGYSSIHLSVVIAADKILADFIAAERVKKCHLPVTPVAR